MLIADDYERARDIITTLLFREGNFVITVS